MSSDVVNLKKKKVQICKIIKSLNLKEFFLFFHSLVAKHCVHMKQWKDNSEVRNQLFLVRFFSNIFVLSELFNT